MKIIIILFRLFDLFKITSQVCFINLLHVKFVIGRCFAMLFLVEHLKKYFKIVNNIKRYNIYSFEDSGSPPKFM